jgi:membrane protein
MSSPDTTTEANDSAPQEPAAEWSWSRAVDYIDVGVWQTPAAETRMAYEARRLLRFGLVLIEGFTDDLMLLRASALTYYSVLALVPLLAIILIVLNGFGVGADTVASMVETLTSVVPEASEKILSVVAGVDLRALGGIGAAILFITTVLGISSIESSLNAIWGVTAARSWDRRLPDYLALIIVLPLLLGVAISLKTTLESDAIVTRLLENPAFSAIYDQGLRSAPLAIYAVGFSFMYWFLPNTRVQLVPCLLGGITAAALFAGTQNVYLSFNVGVSRANAIYGGLAILPLTLAWIYVSWLIVLFGSKVAFAYQNLDRLSRAKRGLVRGPAEREAGGLAIATALARAFHMGSGPLALDEIATAVDMAPRDAREVIDRLEAAGIASPCGEVKEEQFQLGREAAEVSLSQVLRALRGERGASDRFGDLSGPLGDVLTGLDRETERALAARTLADLVAELD